MEKFDIDSDLEETESEKDEDDEILSADTMDEDADSFDEDIKT